jgi:hypothetical protein
MQFCVTRVILRDLAALVPQIFHSLHKITHFLTGYINSYYVTRNYFVIFYYTDVYLRLSNVRSVDKKNWDKNDNCSNSNLANLHSLIQAC